MKLSSNNFNNDELIPVRHAFGRIDPQNHVALSDNINPQLHWQDAPAGTRSFVLICHDPDVPSRGDDVNQEGKTVPASLPRVDFFHWVLLDIPADTHSIAEGSHASGITAGGKSGPAAPQGLRHGINGYTAWFAADEQMKGDYYGYDGPCPPWNDELMHHYIFTVYALDIPQLEIEGQITGQKVRDAMAGHILDQASLTGLYSLNPDVTP